MVSILVFQIYSPMNISFTILILTKFDRAAGDDGMHKLIIEIKENEIQILGHFEISLQMAPIAFPSL